MRIPFFTLFLSLCFSYQSFCSEQTNIDWHTLLMREALLFEDQAYCYTDDLGNHHGEQINQKVRLASVSKLITSLWAIDRHGIDYKYKTRLYIKNNQLHIAGSFDPFMGNEKIFFLLSQLNDLGYNQFQKITFDHSLIIFPNAEGYNENYPDINPETNRQNLMTYFNTQNWTLEMTKEYNRVALLAAKGRIRPEVHFQLPNAHIVEKNPFENDTEVRILTLSSPPLYRYLKEVNTQSNNFVTQALFLELGGTQAFQKYLTSKYDLYNETIYFWTGNGLPFFEDGTRKDNYATCSSILTLIESLQISCEDQGKELEDIIAVPGSDEGTFKNRSFPSDYKNAFVAKTGTLMHTSTLAGAMSTKNGVSYFGLFNQTKNIQGAKRVQNKMVQSIMSNLGGPLSFNYTFNEFDTYGEEDIKNLFAKTFKHTEFIPFEENLYE